VYGRVGGIPRFVGAAPEALLPLGKKMAEREGFEPSEPLRIHMISNHAHSTTLPPLRVVETRVIRRSKGKIKGDGMRKRQTQSPLASPREAWNLIASSNRPYVFSCGFDDLLF
jgi:hypothetical protein